MTFGEAFAKARKEQGAGGTFTYKGKKYSTNRADDKAKTAKNNVEKKLDVKPVKKPKVKKEITPVTKPKTKTNVSEIFLLFIAEIMLTFKPRRIKISGYGTVLSIVISTVAPGCTTIGEASMSPLALIALPDFDMRAPTRNSEKSDNLRLGISENESSKAKE